jgi:hypothetical protein
LNQSNIKIEEVLKASLEHQETSVAFDDVWDKYSKNKGPTLVYKRVTVLVAAVLVLIISIKYISSMPGLSNTLDSAKEMKSKTSMADATYNKIGVDKKLKSSDIKSNKMIAMFSEKSPKSNSNSTNYDRKSKAKHNTDAKAKVVEAKVAEADKINNRMNKTSSLAPSTRSIARLKNPQTVKEDLNAMIGASSVTDAAINIARASIPVTNASIAMTKMATPVAEDTVAYFLIWDNRSYYKTSDIVEQKDLGKSLGSIIKETANPFYNCESNGIPVGTVLYEINGEDSKNVIAVLFGSSYYRVVWKEVKNK